MSYAINTTRQSEAEAEEAYRWIAQYSPEKAMLWYFDLQEAIESLSNFPARCPLAPENHTFKREIRHLIFGRYRILFRIEDETVYILHVRHSSRRTLTPEEEAETDLPDEDADDE